MDMATDADINIEHRLTEVEQRAKSNTNRLNEHDEILKSNSEMIGAIKELATEVKYMRGDLILKYWVSTSPLLLFHLS